MEGQSPVVRTFPNLLSHRIAADRHVDVVECQLSFRGPGRQRFTAVSETCSGGTAIPSHKILRCISRNLISPA